MISKLCSLIDSDGVYSGVQTCQAEPVETVVYRTRAGSYTGRADLELADREQHSW